MNNLTFDECKCSCHAKQGFERVLHCMPCCYVCEHCGKNITVFNYDSHVEKCKKEQDSLENVFKEMDVFLKEDNIKQSQTKEQKVNATIEFTSNEEANEFASQYSRKTLRGHTVSQNIVNVYDITPDERVWIDNYVDSINQNKLNTQGKCNVQ